MRTKIAALIIASLLLTGLPALAQQASNTFTTDDKSFSFDYPSGWSVNVSEDGAGNTHLNIVNTLDNSGKDSPDGIVIETSLPNQYYAEATAGNTPKEQVAQFVIMGSKLGSAPQPRDTPTIVPDVTEFTVNRRSAAYGYLTSQALGSNASEMIVIADLGDNYWVSMYVVSAGGLGTVKAHEADILGIVKTMRYTPAANNINLDLTRTYSGLVGVRQPGAITFKYPQDWHVSASSGAVAISIQPGNENNLPSSGLVIVAIYGVSETRAMVDPTEQNDTCSTTISKLTAEMLAKKVVDQLTPAQLDSIKQQGITYTQPEVTTSNGKEIAYLWVYQNDTESLMLFVDLGNGNIPSMIVAGKKGQLEQFEKQLLAVAGTFEYSPRPCDQIATPEAPAAS